MVLVTKNVGDFDKLARARTLHAGIVLLEDGALVRSEPEEVTRQAVAAIELELKAGRDVVNRVLRIATSGATLFETAHGTSGVEFCGGVGALILYWGMGGVGGGVLHLVGPTSAPAVSRGYSWNRREGCARGVGWRGPGAGGGWRAIVREVVVGVRSDS